MAIPDRILQKAGPLDADEWRIMQSHASIGGEIIGRHDSGIPFDLPDTFNASTFPDPKALTLVHLATGRAKARTLVDAMTGAEVYAHGATKVELQAGVLNVFDTTYLLNFLSIFNGTHYGAPRTWTTRLKVGF